MPLTHLAGRTLALSQSLLAAIALIPCLTACSDSQASPPRCKGVVVILVDTLRADRLSCYGHSLGTSPQIDAVASEGILFERCYSQSNWTKPSVASIFTGLYPRQHGVIIGSEIINNEGEVEKLTKEVRNMGAFPLPDDLPLLAESMARRGYNNFGVIENHHVNKGQGFNRGFVSYDFSRPGHPLFQQKLEAAAETDSPYFGYFHTIGPHAPYNQDENEGFAPYRDRFAIYESAFDFKGHDYKKAGSAVTEGDVMQARGYYDAEVAYFDGEHVGPILDWLRDSGNYDDTLIIITADHGESLYEYEDWAHGHALHEEVIRVPLIVKMPRGYPSLPAGTRIDEVVETIDLFPTLCEFVDIAAPESIQGESLLPLLRGDRATDPTAFAVSEHAIVSTTEVLAASVQTRDSKFIERYPVEAGRHVLDLAFETDSTEFLFEIGSPESERTDLLDERPELAASLKEKLHSRVGTTHVIQREPLQMKALSASEIQDLRALGYLGDE